MTFNSLLRMLDESYAVYWDKVTAKEFAEMPPPATAPKGAGRPSPQPLSGNEELSCE